MSTSFNEELFHKQLMALFTKEGNFYCSEGWVSEYLDAIGAILQNPAYFKHYYEERVGALWPVGTGASGAIVLGLLGVGTLYNPKEVWDTTWAVKEDKKVQQGLLWNNDWKGTANVCLVDDCTFTGATIARLERAVSERHDGSRVLKRVTAWPYQPRS